MDQVQVEKNARLATARREPNLEGRVVPVLKRTMNRYQTIESIVPYTNSIPSPTDYSALMEKTRPYNDAIHVEATTI